MTPGSGSCDVDLAVDVAVDVAVVGGGPAGLAAAIALARAGRAVVVIDRRRNRDAALRRRPAETLPPRARLMLASLGVWDAFSADPAPGMTVAWGDPGPFATDFVANPYGCGWHIDRDRFDGFLAGQAVRAGAEVVAGAARVDTAGPGGWHVRVGDRTVEAAHLVDATGRTASRRGRVRYDRLVALAACVERVDGDEDGRALIEAGPHGWWYSAPHGDRHLAATYMTDADLVRDAGPAAGAAWVAALDDAPLTRDRIAPAATRPPRPRVDVVSAATSRADAVTGDRWLAVGDAAAAHDPLAGQGVAWALEGGLRAAQAIVDDDTRAYESLVRADFERYLRQRAHYYEQERRWPSSPFWHRRLNL